MRVFCDLPNASAEISGTIFARVQIGDTVRLVSDELSQEMAEYFASIPGYSIADLDPQAEAAAREAIARTRAALEAERRSAVIAQAPTEAAQYIRALEERVAALEAALSRLRVEADSEADGPKDRGAKVRK